MSFVQIRLPKHNTATPFHISRRWPFDNQDWYPDHKILVSFLGGKPGPPLFLRTQWPENEDNIYIYIYIYIYIERERERERERVLAQLWLSHMYYDRTLTLYLIPIPLHELEILLYYVQILKHGIHRTWWIWSVYKCVSHSMGFPPFCYLLLLWLDSERGWQNGGRPRAVSHFFDLRLNKWLSKHSRHWWLETSLRLLWRHCNVFWSQWFQWHGKEMKGVLRLNWWRLWWI